MTLIAKALIETQDASRYLLQFCEHLNERAQAHESRRSVSVQWSATRGTADFGWGWRALEATSNALTLRVEATDQEGLEQIEEFVASHLEHHGVDQTVTWKQEGAAAGDTDTPGAAQRRQRMRAFHRRARPSAS